MLKQFLKDNKNNNRKYNLVESNLVDYLQGQICKYASQEGTPAEQIKGMNRLLRDIINLTEEYE